jgi:hypothetical protein
MKKLLILLSLCVFAIACDDMQKPVMDVIDDATAPSEEPFGDVPRITVDNALLENTILGGKITGPWIWMIAPTPRWGGGDFIDIDSLGVASNGVITEIGVSTNGVAAGDRVGDLTWTLGTISGLSTRGYSDNVNDTINKIGLAEGSLNAYSSYALINLVSDTDRSNLTMWVGSDDAIKVWLNGEVVHRNAVDRGANDFQDEFTVDLKAGSNLLLVKVSELGGHWAMFVGIEDPTIEVVISETTAPEIPEITFENALNLVVGRRYRFRPTHLGTTTDRWGDVLLSGVTWGNIDHDLEFVERSDFPTDAPKIRLDISFFENQPYFETHDGKPIIRHTIINNQPISDEILVAITASHGVVDARGGQRGNKFDFKHIRYQAVAIENLTRPDRVFEYE